MPWPRVFLSLRSLDFLGALNWVDQSTSGLVTDRSNIYFAEKCRMCGSRLLGDLAGEGAPCMCNHVPVGRLIPVLEQLVEVMESERRIGGWRMSGPHWRSSLRVACPTKSEGWGCCDRCPAPRFLVLAHQFPRRTPGLLRWLQQHCLLAVTADGCRRLQTAVGCTMRLHGRSSSATKGPMMEQ